MTAASDSSHWLPLSDCLLTVWNARSKDATRPETSGRSPITRKPAIVPVGQTAITDLTLIE